MSLNVYTVPGATDTPPLAWFPEPCGLPLRKPRSERWQGWVTRLSLPDSPSCWEAGPWGRTAAASPDPDVLSGAHVRPEGEGCPSPHVPLGLTRQTSADTTCWGQEPRVWNDPRGGHGPPTLRNTKSEARCEMEQDAHCIKLTCPFSLRSTMMLHTGDGNPAGKCTALAS